MLSKSILMVQISRLATASYITNNNIVNRRYAKKSDDKCRKAYVDIPPEGDPKCPVPCAQKKKKKGILHRIKLRVVEGGTNFGTPFRRLECGKRKEKKEDEPEQEVTQKQVQTVPKALPLPSKKKVLPVPEPRPGVQVSIIGAETTIGQYIALLLKQCPCIKKLRLYEAQDTQCSPCNRDLCNIVHDLCHINTNCTVQMFSCACLELERCLQNTDIVLILESGCLSGDMSFEERFCYQAPIIKRYADVIATECPRAFVIVCATPIDCMVPLIAETLKETGWYDPRKLLGSMAVPEMRASTLAARALCLEPRYTRVPCIGGTEGDALVPLFSKAVEYFHFPWYSAEMMTQTIRESPKAVAEYDSQCCRASRLSEAHALAGLVTNVSYALLCQDVPRITGYVETDTGQIISPARYLSINVKLNGEGICKKYDFPDKLTQLELNLMDMALANIKNNVDLAQGWFNAHIQSECHRCQMTMQKQWQWPKHYDHLDDCTAHLT